MIVRQKLRYLVARHPILTTYDTRSNDVLKMLKEHGQLVHMRIRYHFIANLHIALHHKTRERRTETEKRINKPCRIKVFANQSSGYIHVTLLEH